MKRREVTRKHMMGEYLNQGVSRLRILGDFLNSLRVVLLVPNDTPDLNEGITYPKIGALRAFPVDVPRNRRMNLMGQTTIRKPAVNGIFPLRVSYVAVWTATAARKTSGPTLDPGGLQSLKNKGIADAKSVGDKNSGLARFVATNNFVNRNRLVIRRSFAAGMCAPRRLLDFWAAKIVAGMRANGNPGDLKPVANAGRCHADFAADFMRTLAASVFAHDVIMMLYVLKYLALTPLGVAGMGTKAGDFGAMPWNLKGGSTLGTGNSGAVFSHILSRYEYTTVGGR